jgi:hypothetical protein
MLTNGSWSDRFGMGEFFDRIPPGRHVKLATIVAHGIHYVKFDHPRYKYKLVEPHTARIELHVDAQNEYFRLEATGKLFIQAEYAWDGPSGPTFDTPDFMRGSLVHDVIYQMLREKMLDPKKHSHHRNYADRLLRRMCLEDGMPRWRALYVYAAVRAFGGKAAAP